MVVSTGAGAAAAIGLMLLSPLGETLNGIWWSMGALMVVRGLVFVFAYRRSAETAVRS
jgi:Na+-driven multidrug efflux pump